MGPNAVMRASVSNGTGTGDSTQQEPPDSFTMVIRVVNMIPMSRTFGPLAIHIFLPNGWSPDTGRSFKLSCILSLDPGFDPDYLWNILDLLGFAHIFFLTSALPGQS
jgi:hypothetical protein